MKHTSRLVLFSCLLYSLTSSADASNYSVSRHTINCGGGTANSARYSVTASVGQPVAGYISGNGLRHSIGFWLDEGRNLRMLESIDAAKVLGDGTPVSIAGMIATCSADDFSGFFYMEEPQRSSGIRVVASAGAIAGLARYQTVDVTGTLSTTAEGERQIISDSVSPGRMHSTLLPLGMNNGSLGGGDFAYPPLGQYGVTGGQGVNNVGLLVTIWGLVTDKTADYIVVDDGSGASVRVDTTGISSVPSINSYVGVVGISSIFKGAQDRKRVVLPRDEHDITPFQR